MGNKFVQEMKVRKKSKSERQVKALHELIDRLVVGEDGRVLTDFQRAQLHEKADEMDNQACEDAPKLDEGISTMCAGTVEGVMDGMINQVIDGVIEGMTQTGTEQPQRVVGRRGHRKRRKKRRRRRRRRNQVI